MKNIRESWRFKMDENKREELKQRCSESNLSECTDIEVNTRAVSNTAFTIIISSLVTAFALVFSLAILDTINSYIEGSYWLQLLITLILLLTAIFLLIYFQQKKKIWESENEIRLQKRLGYKKP